MRTFFQSQITFYSIFYCYSFPSFFLLLSLSFLTSYLFFIIKNHANNPNSIFGQLVQSKKNNTFYVSLSILFPTTRAFVYHFIRFNLTVNSTKINPFFLHTQNNSKHNKNQMIFNKKRFKFHFSLSFPFSLSLSLYSCQ